MATDSVSIVLPFSHPALWLWSRVSGNSSQARLKSSKYELGDTKRRNVYQSPQRSALERWQDILLLDLRKQKVRRYLIHKLREIVEDYGIDGFRFDNVVESSYTPYSTFQEIVENLTSRYPHLFIVAEGREPILHNFIQVIYGWDILTTLKHILGHEMDKKLPDLWKMIRVKTGYEPHGLLLGTLRDQDNTFDKGCAPLTNAALMFGLPGFIPCIWMPQICEGMVRGETKYPDNVNRQIKEEAWRAADIREENMESISIPIANLSAFLMVLIFFAISWPVFSLVKICSCMEIQKWEVTDYLTFFGHSAICVISLLGLYYNLRRTL